MHRNDIRTPRISSSQTYISILQRTIIVRVFVMIHEKFNCFLSIHWCLYPLGKNRATARAPPYFTRPLGLPGLFIVGAGLPPALATGRRPPSMLRLLDRCFYHVAPLGPRSIVITDLWIAK